MNIAIVIRGFFAVGSLRRFQSITQCGRLKTKETQVQI